jgi:hypothetical protein
MASVYKEKICSLSGGSTKIVTQPALNLLSRDVTLT